jgi:WD40 repeat protein
MSNLAIDVLTDHEEFIHDLEFDYYGTRLATCSSDLSVKVFDYNKENNVNSS